MADEDTLHLMTKQQPTYDDFRIEIRHNGAYMWITESNDQCASMLLDWQKVEALHAFLGEQLAKRTQREGGEE